MEKKYFIFLFFVALLACRQPSVPEKISAFSKHQWSADNPVKIEIDNNDTVSLFNIFVVVRHSAAFKYNNLLLIYTSFIKDSTTTKINLPLGNGNRWNGDMLGIIVETRVKINREPQKLKQGKNIFILQQIMPDNVLYHILSIGVRIEKTNITSPNRST